MTLLRLLGRGLAFAIVGCFINQSLHAQDILEGGISSGNGIFTPGEGANLPPNVDGLAILPSIPLDSLSTWQVAAGSTLVLNLELFGGGVAPVNSFSISFANEPYLTLSNFTSDLPAGYTYSFNNNVFTAQNVSGTDLSSSTISTPTDGGTLITDTITTLATLTFTLDSNTPLGSILAIPSPDETSSLLDDSGNAIPAGCFQLNGTPEVVAPEPSTDALLGSGFGLLALLAFGARRRSFAHR